ncbi:tripartite motif containing 108 [Electrophorus electricus]|uniref:tripartite motif containing 108 n=1 Tax=Electrophorus electricus TaxID=8005 RepID=UPI0015CFCEFA|nr:tripartite motif containing 108 [Electrophorus electricus]
MASQLSLQIKCTTCLCDNEDPVTLHCEHAFCHQCIMGHLGASLGPSSCPECHMLYDATDLRPNCLLKTVTGVLPEHLTTQNEPQASASPTDGPGALTDTLVCAEHDEKLKLCFETDQKLVCGADGCHGFTGKENRQIADMVQKQVSEISKTEMKSKHLSAQISAQFERMPILTSFMMGIIEPIPENLNIKDPIDSYLKVSTGDPFIQQTDRRSTYYKDYSPGVDSVETFRKGQHYWEVEVGKKLDWSVGVKEPKATAPKDVHLHLKYSKGYTLSKDGQEVSLSVHRKPSKIGLYLDCEREEVLFYDADRMSLIYLESYRSNLTCSISLFPGLYRN